jgi:hypothetical protein
MKLLNESVVELIWRGADDLLRRESELQPGTAEMMADTAYGKAVTNPALSPAPRAFFPALFLCTGAQEQAARLVRMKGSECSH